MSWTYVIDATSKAHYSFYDNAQEIWNFAKSVGCTDEAAAGLLGNIEAESYCNPGQYEIGKGMSQRWGMGLIQWTPTQSYWDDYHTNPIVAELGSNWFDGAAQMDFIFGNDISGWIPTASLTTRLTSG